MISHIYHTGFTTNLEYFSANQNKKPKFTILYTHGFCSDPWGRKPEEVKKWCAQNGIDFVRYELAGHGSDSARFEETDINIWKAQILELIDEVIAGDIIVVGSSLGGWLSLLAAINRKERVKGVLGLAAAPDFTADYEKYATPEIKKAISEKGKFSYEGSGMTFTITKKLLDSGNENLILDKPSIPVICPVVLIQGMKDESVPFQKAVQIISLLESQNAVLKLLKTATHRLNEDQDVKEILSALNFFL